MRYPRVAHQALGFDRSPTVKTRTLQSRAGAPERSLELAQFSTTERWFCRHDRAPSGAPPVVSPTPLASSSVSAKVAERRTPASRPTKDANHRPHHAATRPLAPARAL